MGKLTLAADINRSAGLLDEKIRRAREAHADQLQAVSNIHDAAVLRLHVLRDTLAPILSRNAAARSIVDLAMVPGNPPRLWIDMTSYIVMAPDPSTYRLLRDGLSRATILFETKSRDEMVQAVLNHVASHLVEREKQLRIVTHAAMPVELPGFGHGALLLAWLSGMTVGVSLIAAVLGWGGH